MTNIIKLTTKSNNQKYQIIKSYARKINARYHKQDSHFVTLKERLNEQLDEFNSYRLEAAVKEFIANNSHWNKFSDLNLCKALECPIDKILIDTTMQRPLDFRWVMKIISRFVESKVMSIQVYEDPTKPGFYIAWDGQHTAIALYTIISKVFGDKLANCMVPIVVYPMSKKAEIRENFIGLNGDDKLGLDKIDLFMQMIYGVRVDGSTNPAWVVAEEKQQYLEAFDMFVTAEKFGDHGEPGAISRLEELSTSNPMITRQFAKYFTAVGQERAVEPKEIVMMYWYLNACRDQDIVVTEEYVQDLALVTKNLFDADFSPEGTFWGKVYSTYYSWHKEHYKDWEDWQRPDPRPQKEIPHGATYFTAQLRKSLEHPVPRYSGSTEFRVLAKDLW